jgi:hypothetical protein
MRAAKAIASLVKFHSDNCIAIERLGASEIDVNEIDTPWLHAPWSSTVTRVGILSLQETSYPTGTESHFTVNGSYARYSSSTAIYCFQS